MNYPNLEEISDYLQVLGVKNQIDKSERRIYFLKAKTFIQEILGKPLRIGLPDKHSLPDRKEFTKDVAFTWNLIKLLEHNYLIVFPKYDIWEIHYGDGSRDN